MYNVCMYVCMCNYTLSLLISSDYVNLVINNLFCFVIHMTSCCFLYIVLLVVFSC